ncbi:MAG: hypothetical protein LKH62_04205 [Atopobiaceae bacterium]|nr:hypothetical protein [Atopobiaceae bacterium]MCI1497935.1 hypothetical protein [Atopobiaceae bacterium]MCI1539654.1 hypothetical protein [Atopobiaceae bacterium]
MIVTVEPETVTPEPEASEPVSESAIAVVDDAPYEASKSRSEKASSAVTSVTGSPEEEVSDDVDVYVDEKTDEVDADVAEHPARSESAVTSESPATRAEWAHVR